MYADVTSERVASDVRKSEPKKIAFENIIKTFNLPPGSIRYGYNEETGEGCWDSVVIDNIRFPKKLKLRGEGEGTVVDFLSGP